MLKTSKFVEGRVYGNHVLGGDAFRRNDFGSFICILLSDQVKSLVQLECNWR